MIRFFQILKASGIWAPITVLILHSFLSIRGYRTQIDWFNHFSGGLSFSYFIWKSSPFVTRWIGNLTALGRISYAFLAGCTAALVWEIGEFLSDIFLGTAIQQSLQETMIL